MPTDNDYYRRSYPGEPERTETHHCNPARRLYRRISNAKTNAMFDVYKDKIKELILRLYMPGEPGIGKHDLRLSTLDVMVQLRNVIPANFIDEPTVYECLEELGFEPKYESKQEIVEREIEGKTESKGKQLIENDIVDYDDLTYFWYFKKREND